MQQIKVKKFTQPERAINIPAVHSDPMMDTIYKNRGICRAEELDHELRGILSPWTMKDIHKAASIIIKHIMKGSTILIVGDYDADGATSTTIAVDGLYMLGARRVEYIVPDRSKHGYGLSIPLVNEIMSRDYGCDLIVTVDNGITAFSGIAEARKQMPNTEIVVTDHHLPDEKGGLPDCHAIVNPNQIGCEFESKNLAGCGVMFYTIMATRAIMEEQGVFQQLNILKPDIRLLLDVLALGTIADVVTLDRNNRILVTAGINRMNANKMRHGIRELLRVGGATVGEIVASDMGFKIGPRINAAGRLSNMEIGIECLLSKTAQEAAEIAGQLDYLNKQRREVEKDMVDEANEYAAEFIELEKSGMVVYGEGWHEGVIGIVASRLKEKANRPVIVFGDTEDKNGVAYIKGSARSVAGIHLKHVLKEISSKHPEVLVDGEFGGHAMAAGLSLKKSALNVFSELFDAHCEEHLTQDIKDGLMEVDFEEFPEEFLDLHRAHMINQGGPWGQNFVAPLFCGIFDVVEAKPIGADGTHLKMTLQKGGKRVDAIQFGCIPEGNYEPLPNRVKIVFTMDINKWRGNETLQLMVKKLERLENTRIDADCGHQVNIPSLAKRKRDMDSIGLNSQNGNIIGRIL